MIKTFSNSNHVNRIDVEQNNYHKGWSVYTKTNRLTTTQSEDYKVNTIQRTEEYIHLLDVSLDWPTSSGDVGVAHPIAVP